MDTQDWKTASLCNLGGCVEVGWQISSLCHTTECVEVGWQNSSFCGANGCVNVAHHEGNVLVRDSKDPDGAQLTFTPEEWAAFVAGVKNGEFDPAP